VERIPWHENMTVVIRAAGNVCVRGWENLEVQSLSDSNRQALTQVENDTLYIVAKSDLCVFVPVNAPVRVEHASGHAYLCGLVGPLLIQKVGGDLSIESCREMDISVVGGDLLMRALQGPIQVKRVGGDLTGSGLGDLVAEVGGDVRVHTDGRGVRLKAGGDLAVFVPAQSAGDVALRAGGDVELYTGADLDARLDIGSGTRDMEIELGGGSHQIEDDVYSAVLGAGSRTIEVRAGGDIRISDDEWDEDDLEDSFADVHEEWEEWVDDLEDDEGEEADLPPDDLNERIQRKVEATTRKAEQRVREAMARVERKNRKRQDIFSRFGIRWGNFWPNVPKPPKVEIPTVEVTMPPMPSIPPVEGFGFEVEPEVKPGQKGRMDSGQAAEQNTGLASGSAKVSNEERLHVLKMLREHKISVEEAEELLRMLGGE
jgi:hypothetical protein